MLRRDYPETGLAQRETRREKRLFAMLIGIPALLFLTFLAFYFAPWEIAHRERAATVLRAQVEALPPYNTDRLQQVNSVSQHGVTVTAYYSRNEICTPILDYYRQIVPTHSWTFTRTARSPSHPPVNDIDTSDTTDYYTGVFEGYSAELEVDCDLSNLGYKVTATGPSLCLWSCL